MKIKKITHSAKNFFARRLRQLQIATLSLGIGLLSPISALAQSGPDYNTGVTALGEVTTGIKNYIPAVTNVCYALAGVVAIIGAISVYIAMNNEEQDVKKKIMMTVGSCIFLIAAAKALPAFFGL